jgi:tRNA (cytidine/uridine-2'-O-)-methyltransferase
MSRIFLKILQAIIRTCACLGAKLEIIEPCGFHLSDKRFKRVVMDYMDLNKIEIHQSAEKFFEAKKNHRVVLMTTKASISYLKFKFEKNDTILFGRESAGVPENIHQSINDRLKNTYERKCQIFKYCIFCCNCFSRKFKTN